MVSTGDTRPSPSCRGLMALLSIVFAYLSMFFGLVVGAPLCLVGTFHLWRSVQASNKLAELSEIEKCSRRIEGKLIERTRSVNEITGRSEFVVRVKVDCFAGMNRVSLAGVGTRVVTLTEVHHGARELYETTAQSSVVDARFTTYRADDLERGYTESVIPELLFQRKLNDARIWTKYVTPAVAFVCLAAYAGLCATSFFLFTASDLAFPVRVGLHTAGSIIPVLFFLAFWCFFDTNSAPWLETFRENPKDFVTKFDRFRQIYDWLGPTPVRKVQFLGAVIGAVLGCVQGIIVGFLFLALGLACLLWLPHEVQWSRFVASFDVIGRGIIISRRRVCSTPHRERETKHYVTVFYGVRSQCVDSYQKREFSVNHSVYEQSLVNNRMGIAVLSHYPGSGRLLALDTRYGLAWRCFELVCGTALGFVMYSSALLLVAFEVFAVLPVVLCYPEANSYLRELYHKKVKEAVIGAQTVTCSLPEVHDAIEFLEIDQGEARKFLGVPLPSEVPTGQVEEAAFGFS